MLRPWRAWCERDLIVLEEMTLDGRTGAEIGLRLGRTVAAVRGACRRLGIVLRPRVRALAWIDLLSAGLHPAECARRLGCLPQNGRRMKCKLKRLGLVPGVGRTAAIYTPRTCKGCGRTFRPHNSNKVRCPPCQQEHRRGGPRRWPSHLKRRKPA